MQSGKFSVGFVNSRKNFVPSLYPGISMADSFHSSHSLVQGSTLYGFLSLDLHGSFSSFPCKLSLSKHFLLRFYVIFLLQLPTFLGFDTRDSFSFGLSVLVFELPNQGSFLQVCIAFIDCIWMICEIAFDAFAFEVFERSPNFMSHFIEQF